MKRVALGILLASLLTYPPAVAAVQTDAALVRQALEVLKTRHWNPNLDIPALIRAGVDGLRRELRTSAVDPRPLQEVPTGLNETETLVRFSDRLGQAVRLGGGQLSERRLTHAAIRDMLKAVGNSHTFFLTPELAIVSRYTGYSGIAIRLAPSDGRWIVCCVLPGGPADRRGIRPGDRVLRVDDRRVEDLVFAQAYTEQQLLSQAGQRVRLSIQRGSRTLSVSVDRETIRRPIADSRMLDGEVGYVKLYGYPAGAPGVIRQELERLMTSRPRGLIVDLRDNAGGDRTEDILSFFLPSDTRVTQYIGRDGIIRDIRTLGTPIVPQIPIIALIGPGTISAGEQTVAALKESDRATLVGERTAGGLERVEVVTLSDGSEVWVSVRRVLTGKGVEVEGKGISPDVEVRSDPERSRDRPLEQAIQALKQRLKR